MNDAPQYMDASIPNRYVISVLLLSLAHVRSIWKKFSSWMRFICHDYKVQHESNVGIECIR